MTGLRKRLVVFFLGLAICLLVLEVALRVVGVYYVNLSEHDGSGAVADAEMTILSIGDSVTFGIGASQGFSYPEQLEKMLNDLNTGKKYKVINRGRPAQNTAQLLTRLEGQLKEYHPDIVTILIGAQNQANYFGYQSFLARQEKKNANFLYRLHNIFDHIRVYKFVRLLILHNTQQDVGTVQIAKLPEPQQLPKPSFHPPPPPSPQPGMPAGLEPAADIGHPEELKHLSSEELADYFPGPDTDDTIPPGMYPDNGVENTPECVAGVAFRLNGEYDKALVSILGVIKKQEVESECYNVAGAIYSDQGEYENAVKMFKKGIERDPGQFRNYEGIGECYRAQGDLESAIDWFEKGFAAARYETLYELCYVGISDAYKDSGEYQRAAEFFGKEMKRTPQLNDYLHTLASDYFAMFQSYGEDEDIHNWISADIEEILALCARYNATPILQNYPTEEPLALLYKKIAGKNGVLFVDQNTTFRPFTPEGELDDEYFVPDGHPNAKGYHLMAKNLLNVIKDKLLEFDRKG